MRTEAQFDELLSQGSHAKEELLAALQTLVLSIRDRAVETSLVLCPEPLDEPDESAKPEKAEYAPTQAELFFRTALETEQPVPKLSEATDDYIPVHPVHNGGEATRRATALLGKIIRWLNQNPLHSFRGTGVIHCPGADFEEELKAVALARKKLRDVLVEIHPDRQTRRQLIVGSPLARLHQVQLGREIKLLRPDCDKVSFFWTGNSMKIDRTTVQAYLRGLRSVKYDDDDPRKDAKEEAKSRLVEGLKTLPLEMEIVVARDAAPAPQANIRVNERWVEHRAAVMPFVFTGSQMPEISQLPEFYRTSNLRSSYWRNAEPLFDGIKHVFKYVETPRAAQRRMRKEAEAAAAQDIPHV